ncbi:MAG: hypothetical protein FWF96_01080, partial [Kiritimatiellaeota bacterium]|nr:hypothetical protein [Kiritimatiellota bacterium]
KLSNIIGSLMGAYDRNPRLDNGDPADWGHNLGRNIDQLKDCVGMCRIMLSVVNEDMRQGITNTARRVFFANLPRGLDGELDPDVRDDFYFASFGGDSGEPDADAGTSGGSFYLRGLRNTEEDELLFLNMADGVPPGVAHVRLRDYFNLDEDVAGNGLDRGANGLDQWFIRCRPDESARANAVSIQRDFAPVPGIVRGYKNANYDEGASALTKVHRGNHVWSDPMAPPQNTNMNRRLRSVLNALMNPIRFILDEIERQARNMLNDLIDIDPSCVNHRERFVDQCEHTADTYGLCAEYEWGTAKWFCGWWNLIFTSGQVHIGIPADLFLDGCPRHGYGGLADSLKALVRMLNNGGHSRGAYRSCFVGVGGTTVLRAHARIYGDDREIYDSRYTGVEAMPWVLDQRFYDGAGTIWVGAARVQRNPFERLVNEITPEGFYAAFSPAADGRHIVAMAAGRAGHGPRTGRGRAEGADTVNTGGQSQGIYDLRYDEATDHKFRPSLHNAARDALGAAKKNELEEEWRLGCVCGDRVAEGFGSDGRAVKTTDRLRRQWNLSQTDWDGMLLPVRYTLSGVNATHDSAAPAANPAWAVAGEEAGTDAVTALLLAILQPYWHNMEGDAKPTPEILKIPRNGPGDLRELFRRRRIL